jgi:4-hydroxymandelate oxidase
VAAFDSDTGPDFAGVSLAGLERIARERLPSNAYDFFRTGSGPEVTIDANVAAWRALRFLPRVLNDMSTVRLATSVLGASIDVPMLIAPMSLQRMAHPDAELGMARATAAAGTIMLVSMGTTIPLDQLAAVPGYRFWMQLYALRDRAAAEDLVRQAVEAGAGAFVLTVDAVVSGDRTSPIQRWPKGGLIYPPGVTEALVRSDAFVYDVDLMLTWDYVRWLASLSSVPVVLKGVMHPDDARRAADEGIRALVVSNHGGRVLDSALSTAEALEGVVSAVGDDLEVYVDSGIRRGGDVLKALALGARAVLVGRPVLWGLAAGGEMGATHALRVLREELAIDASLTGVQDVTRIPEGLVRWSRV